MTLIDFDKLTQDYDIAEDDYGFSAISEEEYNQNIDKSATAASNATSQHYLNKLQAVEKIIIPFLKKLHDSGDKEYIYWPNRKEIIEKQIQNILKLTRD